MLNYPSMNLQIPLRIANQSFSAVFVRTVTNVGARNATYTATATPAPLFGIAVAVYIALRAPTLVTVRTNTAENDWFALRSGIWRFMEHVAAASDY
ncbi:hypothetical protein LINPERHAP2_LOCUS14534 [Linum perenne]